MLAVSSAVPLASERSSKQVERDSEQSCDHEKAIAQSHHSGASLVEVCPIERDRESSVTRAMTLPPMSPTAALSTSVTLDHAGQPAPTQALPGQLDQWLALH